MKKSISALCLITLLCLTAHSQRIITGTITEAATGIALPGAHIIHGHQNVGTITNTLGHYQINWERQKGDLVFSFPGCESKIMMPTQSDTLDVKLVFNRNLMSIDTVITFDPEAYEEQIKVVRNDGAFYEALGNLSGVQLHHSDPFQNEDWNTEDYSPISENNDKNPLDNPLSTFSIDVDNASYSNVRRFLNQGQLPPTDAVRIEEMINYFNYKYPQPNGNHPFSISTELSDCPWNKDRHLLLVGLQGKDIAYEKLPPSNLVFLLDVSGSMKSANKLPLLKSAMQMLVQRLRQEDRVSIIVYAGAAGLVLPPTAGTDKETILKAIENLAAGGSTAGGAGIELAYKTAKENFLPKGNNRIILATDGDFNVGISSDGQLTKLIEEKRKENIFLTVLGFGTGNYKDNKLELLADKGNGNYTYIDQESEAKKVFVQELGANLFAIAKDVKIQAEFNPNFVKSYRLVGYENRLLNKEDFADDTKDAGELGAGHQVTALYEIAFKKKENVPVQKNVPLRFQQHKLTKEATKNNELAYLHLRYKPIGSEESKLIEQSISMKPTKAGKVSDNFRLATAVAGFGLMLRASNFNKNMEVGQIKELVSTAGKDAFGYQAEMAGLVEKWATICEKGKK